MGNLISLTKNKYGWTGTDTTETIEYIVTVDSTDMLAQEIIAFEELPSVGDLLPENNKLIISAGGITAEREDNRSVMWKVSVEYTLNPYSFSTSQNIDVPRLRTFVFSNALYSRVAKQCYERYYEKKQPTNDRPGFKWEVNNSITKAEKNVQIINTANNEFEAGSLEETYSQQIIQWTQEESRNFKYSEVMKYIGAINSDKVTILGLKFNKKQVLIKNIVPVAGYDDDNKGIWLCTYTIEIAEVDWDLTILNSGIRALKQLTRHLTDYKSYNIKQGHIYLGKGYTASQIMNDKPNELTDFSDWAEFVTEPWPLTWDGQMEKTDKTNTPVTNPVYLKFRNRPLINFNSSLDLIKDEIIPQDAN